MERQLRQVGPKREAGPKYQNLEALHLPNYQLKRGVKLSIDRAVYKLKESPISQKALFQATDRALEEKSEAHFPSSYANCYIFSFMRLY
jgi:redox-sensitive bicupin YhaK (pirin superfamily)